MYISFTCVGDAVSTPISVRGNARTSIEGTDTAHVIRIVILDTQAYLRVSVTIVHVRRHDYRAHWWEQNKSRSFATKEMFIKYNCTISEICPAFVR
jgi:hypothetical protein